MYTLAERYILVDSLLFKLTTTQEKLTIVAIPKQGANRIISLYHSSLFVGCQGVIKTYLTTGDTFFIPGVIHHLR